MILFLSIKDSIIIISVIDKDRFIFKKEIIEQNENLVVSVDKLLKRNRISLKSLKAVALGDTLGGFTASRSIVAVANTLAFALNIKVIKIKKPQINTKVFIKQIYKAMSLGKIGELVSPEYSGPVSITLPKSQ